jgi:hypothetical protein
MEQGLCTGVSEVVVLLSRSQGRVVLYRLLKLRAGGDSCVQNTSLLVISPQNPRETIPQGLLSGTCSSWASVLRLLEGCVWRHLERGCPMWVPMWAL